LAFSGPEHEEHFLAKQLFWKKNILEAGTIIAKNSLSLSLNFLAPLLIKQTKLEKYRRNRQLKATASC